MTDASASAQTLLHRNQPTGQALDPEGAGWIYTSFATDVIRSGQALSSATGDSEVALVPLSGTIRVDALGESWELGGRENVFRGSADLLYLPVGTEYRVRACGDAAEVATCGARAEERFEPRLVTSEDYEVELRGRGPASREVATLMPPEFPAQRLLIVEVWTPAGNWSSYPPHKHDVERAPEEVALEETFYFRLNDTAGFGLARLYSPERDFDHTWSVSDRDLLAVPWGYHTTVAVPGYDMYYLNVLAGETRALTAAEDPDHAWVRPTWDSQQVDERLPR